MKNFFSKTDFRPVFSGITTSCFLFAFFFFLLVGSSTKLYGQIDCSDIDFQFEWDVVTSSSCEGSNCFRVQYEFYFAPKPGTLVSGVSLVSLHFAANLLELDVTDPACGISVINIQSTEDCLTNEFGFSAGEYSITGNQVAIDLPASGGPYNFTFNDPIMVIIIDAFPEEELDVEISDDLLQWNGGTLQTIACEFSIVNNPSPVELDDLTTACSGMLIEFDDPVDNSGTWEIPVLLGAGGSTFTFDEMDFSITVEEVNGYDLFPPEIVNDGLFSTEAEDVNYRIQCNEQGGYTIYIHVVEFDYAPGSSTDPVFTISLDGPTIASLDAEATLTFGTGRAKRAGAGTCCLPGFDDPESVEFSGYSLCDDFVTINVARITPQSSPVSDCQVSLAVTFNWDGGTYPANIDFDQVKLRFDLGFPAGSEVAGIEPYGSGTDIDAQYFTKIDDDTYEYFDNSTNVTIGNGKGFELIVVTSDGCVESFTFTDALVQEEMEVACIPEFFIEDIPACPPRIFGEIKKDDGGTVQEYTVTVTAASSCTSGSPTADFDCTTAYSLCTCPWATNIPLTVTPTNDNNILNGVTTFDLVLITRHIMGIALLSTPYRIIAADADKNNAVEDPDDPNAIRDVILFNETEFPGGNTSWRFIDKEFTFVDPASPFDDVPFDESVICTLSVSGEANFVGIKVGDVNSSSSCGYVPPGFTSELVEDRQDPLLPYHLTAESAHIGKDEIISIPIRAAGTEKLVALQTGFHFDPSMLEFIGVSKGEPEEFSEKNLGLTELEKGNIRALWFTAEDENAVSEGTILFNLTFKALQDIYGLQDALILDDIVMPNLGYDTDGQPFRLSLGITNVSASQNRDNMVIQAQANPNPFTNELFFDVTVPEACDGTLWIFDGLGKLVSRQETILNEGMNRLKIKEASSMPAGAMTWKIVTPAGEVAGTVMKQ